MTPKVAGSAAPVIGKSGAQTSDKADKLVDQIAQKAEQHATKTPAKSTAKS